MTLNSNENGDRGLGNGDRWQMAGVVAVGLSLLLLASVSCVKSYERDNPFDPKRITYTLTATASPTETPFIMVDDFEDGNYDNEFGQGWVVSSSCTIGNGSRVVATTTGGNTYINFVADVTNNATVPAMTGWFRGNFYLISTIPAATIDPTDWHVLAFYLRGTADLVVGGASLYAFVTAHTCDDLFQRNVIANLDADPNTWTSVQIPFSMMAGVGAPTHANLALETNDLSSVGIDYEIMNTSFGSTGSCDVDIDDIRFY